MQAYIFCKVNNINFDLSNIDNNYNNCIKIAADSGLETCELLNIIPDVIIGDFDSVNLDLLEKYKIYDNIKIIEFSAKKDDTDTMLCVKYALENNYKNINIIGGTGGRLDHELANFALLRYIDLRGGSAILQDGANKIRYIKANNNYKIYKSNYKYVSIVPVCGDLIGLNLDGFLYNLKNAYVKFEEPYTICNEIVGEFGEINFSEGCAYLIESRGELCSPALP